MLTVNSSEVRLSCDYMVTIIFLNSYMRCIFFVCVSNLDFVFFCRFYV